VSCFSIDVDFLLVSDHIRTFGPVSWVESSRWAGSSQAVLIQDISTLAIFQTSRTPPLLFLSLSPCLCVMRMTVTVTVHWMGGMVCHGIQESVQSVGRVVPHRHRVHSSPLTSKAEGELSWVHTSHTRSNERLESLKMWLDCWFRVCSPFPIPLRQTYFYRSEIAATLLLDRISTPPHLVSV